LHTIELATGAEVLAARSEMWFYSLGLPVIAAAPFFIGLWAFLVFHFQPKNRAPGSGAPNIFLRAAVVLATLLVLLAGVPAAFTLMSGAAVNAETQLFLGLYGLSIMIIGYVNLRMTPYNAIAVCRGSLAPAGLLNVTRGWNIARLGLILFFLALIIALIEFLISAIATPAVLSTIGTILVTLGSYTKLTNGSEDPSWVLPLWAWFVGILNVVVTLFWTFFSYGVTAGLYGRLFRESERAS